jgi:hypothetical protein
MIERIIPEDVKAMAHQIARLRVMDHEAKGRRHTFLPGNGMTRLEADWSGTIGEMMLQRAWPLLRRIGEPIYREKGYLPDSYAHDFDHPTAGTIEAKTLTLPQIYPGLFVNAQIWKRRLASGDNGRIMVFLGLDDRPQWAASWYALGWLPYQNIGAYPLKTQDVDTPCYVVKTKELRNLELLLGSPVSR